MVIHPPSDNGVCRQLLSATALCLLAIASVSAHPPESSGRHNGADHVAAKSDRTWTNTRTGESITGSFLAANSGFISVERPDSSIVFIPVDDLPALDHAEAGRLIAQARQINTSIVAPAQSTQAAPAAQGTGRPSQAAAFDAFAPYVKTRWDNQWLYVESDGLPHPPAAHNMMVGIRSWQQQVPLPQTYTGSNAWQIPLRPILSSTPISGKTQLYRGAVALAINGVPIFNALNNRGDDAYLAGELDEFGGHCGRADDYHYHVAPLVLQKVVGPNRPIAYALDGFPVLGLFDPTAPANDPKACCLHSTEALDEYNGHFGRNADGSKGLYHYHASTTFPYINGGVRGQVAVRGDSIDPQPRANPIREAGRPLRGATITGFKQTGEKAWALDYTLAGQKYTLSFDASAQGFVFSTTNPDGTVRSETFSEHRRGGGGWFGGSDSPPPPPPPRREDEGANGPQRPDRPRRDDSRGPESGQRSTEPDSSIKPVPGFTLSSPAVGADGRLPATFTCDGGSVSPPLRWSTPPSGTKSLAIIMHHSPGPGDVHVYWVLYNLPASTTSVPTAISNVGQWGANTVNRSPSYAPPCSKGPGDKTYTITLYALSEPVTPEGSPVTRESLLAAIKPKVLGTAKLDVVYARTNTR